MQLFSTKRRRLQKAEQNTDALLSSEAAVQNQGTHNDSVIAEKDALGANSAELEVSPPSEQGTGAAAQVLGNEQEDDFLGFRSLGVSEWLDKVCLSLGMTTPTAVQKGCIPPVLHGKDVIGTAHTGSGKTAAFAIPILQKLSADPFGIFALVLTPTRELAFQLADQFRALGAGTSLKECVVVGGLDMQTQARALAQRPHVVIGTPGRLRDLIQNEQDLAKCFARVQFLVLDEADRLLEPTFESEMKVIATALPPKRQTLLFSATMTKSLVTMQRAVLQDAFYFQAYSGLETAEKLKEEYIFIPSKVKDVYLYFLLSSLEELKIRSAMIFVSRCSGCHLLDLMLEELGIPCVSLHSHKSQKRRLAALDRFKSGSVPILLATDVASRGLDIPSVDLVINFDLPMLARDYVHRVGRTARANRDGWALSFVSQYDVDLVHKIEKLIGHTLVDYKMDEKAVLKSITKVYTARRAAALRVSESETQEEGRGKLAARNKKKRDLQT